MKAINDRISFFGELSLYEQRSFEYKYPKDTVQKKFLQKDYWTFLRYHSIFHLKFTMLNNTVWNECSS